MCALIICLLKKFDFLVNSFFEGDKINGKKSFLIIIMSVSSAGIINYIYNETIVSIAFPSSSVDYNTLFYCLFQYK